jgi:hypothetical protein
MSIMPPFNYPTLRHDGHGVITVFQHLQLFPRQDNQSLTRVRCRDDSVPEDFRQLVTLRMIL